MARLEMGGRCVSDGVPGLKRLGLPPKSCQVILQSEHYRVADAPSRRSVDVPSHLYCLYSHLNAGFSSHWAGRDEVLGCECLAANSPVHCILLSADVPGLYRLEAHRTAASTGSAFRLRGRIRRLAVGPAQAVAHYYFPSQPQRRAIRRRGRYSHLGDRRAQPADHSKRAGPRGLQGSSVAFVSMADRRRSQGQAHCHSRERELWDSSHSAHRRPRRDRDRPVVRSLSFHRPTERIGPLS